MPVGKRQLSSHPNAVRAREFTRKKREQGLCRCGGQIAVHSKSRCQICLDSDIRVRQSLRRKIIDYYGSRCACCGESEYQFLSIDHVNGNGNKHRESVGGSKKSSILNWIVRNNYPSDFQILCHNCNMAKGCYGVCPHNRDKQVGI